MEKAKTNGFGVSVRVVPEGAILSLGNWLVSGHVDFQILQGGSPAIATLVFPYKDAASEREAMGQVLPALQGVIEQLMLSLNRLKVADTPKTS